MGEKGNLTGSVEQGKLPGLPKLGSTATEAGWDKGPSGEWPKGPANPDFGKPTEASWDKGPSGDWTGQPGQHVGPSVQAPQGPPQAPPPGVPPIGGGFVAGGRRERDDDQQQPPGGNYPPPQPSAGR